MRAFIAVLLAWALAACASTPAQAGRPLHGSGSATIPLCQNVSVTMGANTALNMGTVLLKNLGITANGSAPIVSWRTANVVPTGGGASSNLGGLLASNTATATARSPKPTLGAINSLTTVTLPATSYDIDVTEVTAGGLEATCKLTYVTQANAFNLGDNNAGFGSPDDLSNDTFTSRMSTKTGGLTMLISTGADLTASAFYLHGLAPSSGRTTVQYADAARPSRIPSLHILDTSNFDVTGLGIGGGFNLHKIWLAGTTTGTTVKNSFPLGASIADVSIGNNNAGNVNFIYLQGVSGNTIDNNYLLWGGRGIVLGSGTNGNTVSNNTIRYAFGDLSAVGASTNDTVTGNLMLSPMRDTDTGGNPDHIDVTQWDGGTITGLVWTGNIAAEADGTAAASGFQGGAFTYESVTYAYNVTLFRANTAADWAQWHNGLIEDSTFLLVGSGKISQAALNANDNVGQTQSLTRAVTGTSPNTMLRVFVPGARNLDASWTTVTNSAAQGLSIPNSVQFTYGVADSFGLTINHEPNMGGSTYATSGVFKYANTLERLNNYNAITNPAGADYANMTPAQIKALVLDVLTPATGGSLDLGGGVTIGAVTLGGLLKP